MTPYGSGLKLGGKITGRPIVYTWKERGNIKTFVLRNLKVVYPKYFLCIYKNRKYVQMCFLSLLTKENENKLTPRRLFDLFGHRAVIV